MFPEKGMFDSQPAALGAVFLFVLVLWLGLWFFRRLQGLSGEEIGLGKTACIAALLAMLMSLKVFPWDRIQAFNGVTATLVSSLQFPNRLLMIANISLTVLAGVVAKWVFVTKGKGAFGAICIAMAVLLFISSQYVSEDILSRDNYVCIQNAEGMGTGNISGAEYLPYGADPSQLWPHAPSGGENLIVEHYKKEAHVMEIACKNSGDAEEAMTLPILYYKGYQAYDLSTGERLPVYAGTNFSVTVIVPAGYEGTVRTVFESPWYWRAAEMVSLVSLIWLCVAAIHGRGIRQDWHMKEVAGHENQDME